VSGRAPAEPTQETIPRTSLAVTGSDPYWIRPRCCGSPHQRFTDPIAAEFPITNRLTAVATPPSTTCIRRARALLARRRRCGRTTRCICGSLGRCGPTRLDGSLRRRRDDRDCVCKRNTAADHGRGRSRDVDRGNGMLTNDLWKIFADGQPQALKSAAPPWSCSGE
jgi:hypothetical protein